MILYEFLKNYLIDDLNFKKWFFFKLNEEFLILKI